jgi:hypothetical protein
VALPLPEVTLRVAADAPFPAGVYRTPMPQLAPANKEDVQVLPTILNAGSPDIEAVGAAMVSPLALVMPIVLTSEDFPTATLPKFAEFMDRETADVLVAMRST